MAGGPEPLNLCKAWGTEQGCKYGKRCKFQHQELPDRASRCWLCSSTQHRKFECPTNQRKDDQETGGKKLEESPGKDGKGKASERARPRKALLHLSLAMVDPPHGKEQPLQCLTPTPTPW